MSNEHQTYGGGGNPATLQAFKNRACSLPYYDPGFELPTPEEIKALLKLTGWSQKQTALITGVNWNSKGSTSVRRWKAPRESDSHRQINYAAWRLMLLAAKVVSVDDSLPSEQELMRVADNKADYKK